MKYKITIEQITTEEKIIANIWGIIGTREIERDTRYRDNPDEPRTRIEDERGSLPPIEKEVPTTSVIYIQEVGCLDLAKVIKAINGLP